MGNLAMLRDLGASIKLTKGVKAADRSAGTTNGPGIDRTQGDNEQMLDSLVLYASTGAVSGSPTAQTVDAKIQHSDDDGASDAYADLDASAAITQITAADSEAEVDVNLHQLGAKKWVRVVLEVGFTGGTSPTIESDAVVALGGAYKKPA